MLAKKSKVLIILGPTSIGKTDLGMELAKKLKGELVSADSRQIYEGLDIGTGKLPTQNSKVKIQKSTGCWIIDGVKIWMYDVTSPKKRYDVAQYIKGVRKIIEEIHHRGNLPIIVGGTGLYIKAIIYGLSHLSIPVDGNLRKALGGLTTLELQEKLRSLSPAKWESLNNSEKNNPRRLIRAIELIMMNPHVEKIKSSKLKVQNLDYLQIGLIAPRLVLNSRIDQRVLLRIDQGMIEEAENLYKKGLSLKRMKELGLEYGNLADYIAGKLTKDELVEKLKTKIHQYAKRQMTWFKAQPNINWFDISEESWQQQVERRVIDWYNSNTAR